jgi:glycine oxidase
MNDIIIIGGGIIGLSVAFELQTRGIKTRIVDAKGPAQESSWAAGGMLAPQLETTKMDASWVLGRSSRDLYSSWIQRLLSHTDYDPHYRKCGALLCARTPEEIEHRWSAYQWQRDEGQSMDRIDSLELKDRIPNMGSRPVGALLFPDEAQVDPRRLCQCLVLACAAVGVHFDWGNAVHEIEVRHGQIQKIKTSKKDLMTDTAIVAAGAWSNLIPGLNLAADSVVPIRGQMLALELSSQENLPFITDHQVYVIPRHHGRVLIGSTMENVGFDRQTTGVGIQSLLEQGQDLWPALKNAKIVETWCGFRPKSFDGLPLIGPSPINGLHLATGHFRNGVLQAPQTATLVADLVMGKETSIDPEAFSSRRAFSAWN